MSLIAKSNEYKTAEELIQQFRKEFSSFYNEIKTSSDETDINNWISFILNIWNWRLLKPAFPGKPGFPILMDI